MAAKEKITVKVVNDKGAATGEMNLPESIYGIRPKDQLIFDAVIMQLASRRQGTAKTKGRSEVRGGGKKPYAQKGTGNARLGTIRSPLMVGGGRVFGPKPRSYEYRIPRKSREQALKSVLSQKVKEGKLFVLGAMDFKKPDTKRMAKMMEGLKVEKALFVDSANEGLGRSVRNLNYTKYLDVRGLNVFDVLKYDNVFLSAESLKQIEGRLSS